jgi:hypothetical protein
MKPSTKFEVVNGTRAMPGAVVSTHTTATACLKAWEKLAYTRGKRNEVAVFFRKAH